MSGNRNSTPANPAYSVVVPVYNSKGTLGELTERLTETFESMGQTFELIFVNDGSKDGSGTILKELAEKNDNVVFVDLLRNFGQHNAILCGLSIATGARVVTIDDDLQNPPEEIPRLVEKLEQDDLEVVYGIPEQKQHDLHRNLGSNLIQLVIRKLFGTPDGGASSFRIISKTVKDCILRYQASFTFIDGLVFQHTSYIGYQPVRHEQRKVGASNYDVRKLALLAMNLFFNFSIAPLRFVFLAGFALAGGAGLFALYILYGKLTGSITFPGYASIMVYFSLLFGALFMFLGLIGEYVGRIAQGVNKAPQYAIRKVISRNRDN